MNQLDAPDLQDVSSASYLNDVSNDPAWCLEWLLTVVPLGDSILNASSLSKIGDFGPVFVWIC